MSAQATKTKKIYIHHQIQKWPARQLSRSLRRNGFIWFGCSLWTRLLWRPGFLLESMSARTISFRMDTNQLAQVSVILSSWILELCHTSSLSANVEHHFCASWLLIKWKVAQQNRRSHQLGMANHFDSWIWIEINFAFIHFALMDMNAKSFFCLLLQCFSTLKMTT